MTLFGRNAIIFGRVIGGGASVAGHELLVSFILRGSGRADAQKCRTTYDKSLASER